MEIERRRMELEIFHEYILLCHIENLIANPNFRKQGLEQREGVLYIRKTEGFIFNLLEQSKETNLNLYWTKYFIKQIVQNIQNSIRNRKQRSEVIRKYLVAIAMRKLQIQDQKSFESRCEQMKQKEQIQKVILFGGSNPWGLAKFMDSEWEKTLNLNGEYCLLYHEYILCQRQERGYQIPKQSRIETLELINSRAHHQFLISNCGLICILRQVMGKEIQRAVDFNCESLGFVMVRLYLNHQPKYIRVSVEQIKTQQQQLEQQIKQSPLEHKLLIEMMLIEQVIAVYIAINSIFKSQEFVFLNDWFLLLLGIQQFIFKITQKNQKYLTNILEQEDVCAVMVTKQSQSENNRHAFQVLGVVRSEIFPDSISIILRDPQASSKEIITERLHLLHQKYGKMSFNYALKREGKHPFFCIQKEIQIKLKVKRGKYLFNIPLQKQEKAYMEMESSIRIRQLNSIYLDGLPLIQSQSKAFELQEGKHTLSLKIQNSSPHKMLFLVWRGDYPIKFLNQ